MRIRWQEESKQDGFCMPIRVQNILCLRENFHNVLQANIGFVFDS